LRFIDYCKTCSIVCPIISIFTDLVPSTTKNSIRCGNPSGCDNTWVYPNPEHPRAIPGSQEGDIYVGGDGEIYRKNGKGDWVKQ
jgi:hypothetical protein